MKVLVTGAGAVLGQGIIKSLRMASTPYHIIAVDPDPRAVGLYWADRAYLVPLVVDPSYLDVVRRIIDRERPDVVLIGTDIELLVYALHKSDIESTYQTRVIVSPPHVIKIADDKWLTYEFLAANGFPCPKSALPGGVFDLLQECDFPLIVKPRTGARSIGVHLVKNEEELHQALSQVENPVIQECIANPEQEYTSGVVLEEGVAKAVVTMRRDLRDGNTYRAYVEPDAPFNFLLAKIAEKLGGIGSLNFQFRVDQGLPKIFEINARFSGTTPLRAHAGFNEVDYIVRHYVLGEPIPAPDVRAIAIFKYWNEIVVQPEQITELANNSGLLDSVVL
ncbi:ATP-grasp domain-containing protein [Aetokthonos hydrillicola Thurmond2011]|jgi:carbamoyl-phosphate synthase large subunit|uniref:ATP-grasp domain-containing protein n=1 Tax=Aetokthonos hydrillicola Thurmond2011 TaxID=2712845 RepID=A0AAP5I726_9CYAN|nr:ATP-grasp domain-containing protein [Aetokthonos hydrillicola]MBO3460067.1 ATP-grasp domain-containing protein [Aetokthonos hydrillicola CCALA 1050]MBW4589534.1 ATP-grasp domain-containing protein [Aetokthonos hydrillicola CCALA 1050]MDR9896041.1 ATP-grasp domain-containing protein [Aetokthonos hydrillicola Thurmond2011]